MVESFVIGAYWGSRAEALPEIKDKVLQTLRRLANTDEQFFHWYERGMSRKLALEKKVSWDMDAIEKICRRAVKKGELDERGYAKNGFVLGLWTGHKDDEASSISFTVGDVFAIPNLSNNCILSIPFKGAARERLLEPAKVKEIMSILVEIWEPDYTVLTSDGLRDRMDAGNKIGWITYQKSIKRMPKISNKVVYEKCGIGHLFYLANKNYYDDYSLTNELLPLKEVIE
jgi:hypothetical protein